MKLKNEIIVICLICFILITITAVSAENNNTEIITASDNVYDDALSVNNENNVLNSTGNFEDLNDMVNGESSTIELDKDYA